MNYSVRTTGSRTEVTFEDASVVYFHIHDTRALWPDGAPCIQILYQSAGAHSQTDSVELSILRLNEKVMVRDFALGGTDAAPQIHFYQLPDASNEAIRGGVAAGFLAFVHAHAEQICACAVAPSYGNGKA
jgi:hypothetical protein